MVYRFGPFEFDDQQCVLRRDGDIVRVRRKVLELLGCLISNRCRVVSKSELFERLWGGIAISQHSLSTAIGEARAALEDSASEQCVIQTSHGYGYRFVAPVTEIAVSGGDPSAAIDMEHEPRAWALRNVFVGREEVIAKLEAGIRAAADRRPGAALLCGEMGIGKTRIAEKIESMLLARGQQAHLARCEETMDAPAFWLWTQILRGVCEVFAADKLRRLMGNRLSELSMLLPDLADLVPDLKVTPGLEPAQARFRLFDGVTRLIKLAAGHSPVVLILDDLHYADEESLRLLSFLARSLRGDRIFILGTHRPIDHRRDSSRAEVLSDFGRQTPVERIVLEGLSVSEVARLLEETAEDWARDSVARALHERTRGNPFFITQLLSLGEKVEELDRLLEEVAPLPALPQDLRSAVLRQLGELPEACGRLLSTAAVIGREFTFGSLESASDVEAGVILDMLDAAAEAGIITRQPEPMGSYRFTHDLVRDVLYDQLTALERMSHHRIVGEALHRHCGIELERHLPEPAHHFPEAATRRLGYEDAARYYRKALQALELRQPVSEERRCDLLLDLAESHFRLALQKQRHIASSPSIAHIQSDYAEMLLARGRAGDCERARELIREALAVADKLQMKALADRLRKLWRR